MDVSVVEAAEVLGVSPRRVRALIEAGQIPARRSGPRHWLVDIDAAKRARARPHPPARRFSARSSWAILQLANGQEPKGLSGSERGRAKQRAELIAEFPPGALSARAEVRRFRAHPGIVERLSDDAMLVLGGSSGAPAHGAELIALDRVEGYVRSVDLPRLVERYALREVNEGQENLLLRVPPSWPFDPGKRFAPAPVVAVDLIDAGDERSVRAGRDLLRRIAEDGASS